MPREKLGRGRVVRHSRDREACWLGVEMERGEAMRRKRGGGVYAGSRDLKVGCVGRIREKEPNWAKNTGGSERGGGGEGGVAGFPRREKAYNIR